MRTLPRSMALLAGALAVTVQPALADDRAAAAAAGLLGGILLGAIAKDRAKQDAAQALNTRRQEFEQREPLTLCDMMLETGALEAELANAMSNAPLLHDVIGQANGEPPSVHIHRLSDAGPPARAFHGQPGSVLCITPVDVGQGNGAVHFSMMFDTVLSADGNTMTAQNLRSPAREEFTTEFALRNPDKFSFGPDRLTLKDFLKKRADDLRAVAEQKRMDAIRLREANSPYSRAQRIADQRAAEVEATRQQAIEAEKVRAGACILNGGNWVDHQCRFYVN